MTDTDPRDFTDRSGGTAMHRDRDARQEAPRRVSAGMHSVEYDEELLVPRACLRKVDLERLKEARWLPLSLEDGLARIAAVDPADPAVAEDARKSLGVERVEVLSITAEDLDRTLANNQDVNPGFPREANRTTLAKVRNYLANRRSFLASRRTVFARGRTGLAMFRTGLAFATTVLLLLRLFTPGWLSLVEAALVIAAVFLMVDGLRWYMPARRVSGRRLTSALPPRGPGIRVLKVRLEGFRPVFERSEAVPGAEALREDWEGLTPVMRRRFLALDRTDLAEERTLLAYFRTLMAKSRTGLALGRTGVAVAGIGVALVRQFHHGGWDIVGWLLVTVGVVMTLEGLFWYFPGRRAGRDSAKATAKAESRPTVWKVVLPPACGDPLKVPAHPRPSPLVTPGQQPGIWGTTGLALERTILAERRNVMARLRTHMSRARTGLAFIRTGMNFTAVGLGLLVSFGLRNPHWTVLEVCVLGLGLLLVGDGLYWFLPSERIRRRLPYCFAEMDIFLPEYTRPVCEWSKAVFDNGR